MKRPADDRAPLEALVFEILGAFFDLRAAGQELGLVTKWGAGNWGLLRILNDEPTTVAKVARMRSVSRQYVQKLANDLIQQGLIVMVENPRHKRSRLMRLTPAGKKQLGELTARFRALLDSFRDEFPDDEVRLAADTIAALRRRLTPNPTR